jgi:hypothetical protein
MAQILDSLPFDHSIHILCCYVNATSKIQIVRISNVPNWYFERVVFPGQRLVFEATPQSLLEIHTGMMASSILSDKIPCDRLCIDEEGSFSAEINQEADEEANNKKPVVEPSNKKNLRSEDNNLTIAALTSVE